MADSDTLNAIATRLMERHLERSKEWFPHELVPWGRGRDFEPGVDWDPEEYALPGAVRSALIVNVLTEDNLPHYHHAISKAFGDDSALGAWAMRWTAEEQRHATVLHDWLCISRAVDLVALERARMTLVSSGFEYNTPATSVVDGLVYLTLQELATRVSHRNTGALLGDTAGTAIVNRVAADENLHFLFYRDFVSEVLELYPSETMVAIERQVAGFKMPGAEMPDFGRHATAIATAGIYDYRVHYEQILLPVVLRHWGIEKLEGLDAAAEQARDRAVSRIARVKRVADRIAAQAAASGPETHGDRTAAATAATVG
jgi:acyl-[acyl-carrier-protein] desaturase